MDDTVHGLLVALKYDLRVATHPASHVFPIFPRSSTHDQEFQMAGASNTIASVVDYVLQTLSKFDQVRISLTTNDRISDKLPNKIGTSAVAPRLNNLGCIYLFSAICSKRRARKDANGSAQSAA